MKKVHNSPAKTAALRKHARLAKTAPPGHRTTVSSYRPTPEQDKALVSIMEWLRVGGWIFTLAGYAGTGKTTLLQHLINTIGRPFLCCAPTGKAASVLRGKIPGLTVKTVHQLLYQPQGESLRELDRLEKELDDARANEKPTADIFLAIKEEKERLSREDVRFTPKPSPELLPGKLVIVDEASMVSRKMMEDFEGTGCKVLFVGDEGQLPPVNDDSWFIGYEHNARLTTVMRQALDSPIIRLSMQVREGEVNLEEYKEGACIITDKDSIDPQAWHEANQVLTGSNASRHRLNRFFRKALGRNGSVLPVAGDKLICLKNDHYKLPPWINGVQFLAAGPVEDPGDGIHYLSCDYDGIEQQLEFYPYHCHKHYKEDLEEEPRESRRGVFEADYAYAITVHKSQGSEWPYVIIADDGMQLGNKPFRQRWLYTAVTRAKEKLILVR